ncbi:hypothetical protein TIFTF001_040989 [Ficus carica]|uniref:Uncharacterized protein n=1 Tax=Ficus carica TaxID=3494 RepID=A0AA87Z9E6_FICCA|nr:hypothetical protein TIFTF001_040980 [Ficus carica]GMN27174.1 hypothetical protein TIFTF001_040989 [Ficus carica]
MPTGSWSTDKVGPLILEVLLLPRFQGDVHYGVLGLRQAVQAPVVLRRWKPNTTGSAPHRHPAAPTISRGLPNLGGVTITRLPEPAVFYLSRTGDNGATAAPDRSGVPLGVPAAMVHDPPSGNLSPGAWGPQIADEDMDLVIR